MAVVFRIRKLRQSLPSHKSFSRLLLCLQTIDRRDIRGRAVTPMATGHISSSSSRSVM